MLRLKLMAFSPDPFFVLATKGVMITHGPNAGGLGPWGQVHNVGTAGERGCLWIHLTFSGRRVVSVSALGL